MDKKTSTQSNIFFSKKLLFYSVMIVIVLSIIEGMSFVVWKIKLPGGLKKYIELLCDQNKASKKLQDAYWLPNTFWHHELNPNHLTNGKFINSKGTKGRDFEVPKPAGELRIICIGDSTVEGFKLKPNQTFPYFLETLLKPVIKKSSKYEDVRVINAGIGSHNSAFNLAYLAYRLIHYMPDIVIIKSTYNDYSPYLKPGMKYDYTHLFPKPFTFDSCNNPYWNMARYSYFLKILGWRVFLHDMAVQDIFSGDLVENEEGYKTLDYSTNKDKYYIYAEHIRSMILLCKGRNIKVFVLDLPLSPSFGHFYTFRYYGDKLAEDFKKVVGRLELESERVASEENVPFIKTGPLDENNFWDHCHNTEQGNMKISNKIYDALLEEINL